MENIEFIKTTDGSLGLYNKELDEIYHSRLGAQKESLEKFIIPSHFEKRTKNAPAIRVLDICFGIGYNSKNALSFYKNCDIHIDALEWDARLVQLCSDVPFYMNEINSFLKKDIKLLGSSINFYIEDARLAVKKLQEPYDVVFLDAFAPNKLPTLWSVEFFAQIKRLMKKTSVFVTYCSAQPVRKAMDLNGFFIGKMLDEKGHSCTTIGTLDESLIELAPDDFDIGLMNTKAGIPYRDEGLCQSVQEIFDRREKELQNSSLEGASGYIKRFC